MDDKLFIVLLVVIPLLLLAGSLFLFLNRLFLAERTRRNVDLLLQARKITYPIRLQAYERLILFLERISPDNLLVRVREHAGEGVNLHLLLLTTLRSEYEHNLSQQLYVSNEAWNKVKEARDWVVTVINETATAVDPEKSFLMFSKAFLENASSYKTLPVQEAIYFLKDEAKQLL